jgi:hypothetical protein
MVPNILKDANHDQPYYCVSKCGPTIHPGHSGTSLLACHFFHIATNGHIFSIQLCYSTVFGTLHGQWTPEDKMHSSKMLKQLTQWHTSCQMTDHPWGHIYLGYTWGKGGRTKITLQGACHYLGWSDCWKVWLYSAGNNAKGHHFTLHVCWQLPVIYGNSNGTILQARARKQFSFWMQGVPYSRNSSAGRSLEKQCDQPAVCVAERYAHFKTGKFVTWNGRWDHSELRMPQSASMKGATNSTGWPQSAKNSTCPHSCNIMPLVATNFSTTLYLKARHGFITTPQGWNILGSTTEEVQEYEICQQSDGAIVYWVHKVVLLVDWMQQGTTTL